MKNKLIPITLFAFLLNGCASVDTYVPPTGQPTAKVAGNFHRDSFYVWQRCELLSIDNKTVSYGFFDGIATKIPVTPGTHSFVAQTTINRGFAKGPYGAIVEVKALVKPGWDYQLNCGINGAKTDAWLSDSAGRKASATFSAPYQNQPIDQVVVMPIVVR